MSKHSREGSNCLIYLTGLIILWWYMLVTQSCPILCDSMDCSPQGSSIHRILQARILEWSVMPYYTDIQNQVSLGGKQFPKMGAASRIKLII